MYYFVAVYHGFRHGIMGPVMKSWALKGPSLVRGKPLYS